MEIFDERSRKNCGEMRNLDEYQELCGNFGKSGENCGGNREKFYGNVRNFRAIEKIKWEYRKFWGNRKNCWE